MVILPNASRMLRTICLSSRCLFINASNLAGPSAKAKAVELPGPSSMRKTSRASFWRARRASLSAFVMFLVDSLNDAMIPAIAAGLMTARFVPSLLSLLLSAFRTVALVSGSADRKVSDPKMASRSSAPEGFLAIDFKNSRNAAGLFERAFATSPRTFAPSRNLESLLAFAAAARRTLSRAAVAASRSFSFSAASFKVFSTNAIPPIEVKPIIAFGLPEIKLPMAYMADSKIIGSFGFSFTTLSTCFITPSESNDLPPIMAVRAITCIEAESKPDFPGPSAT
mmetsp:Transcript_8270/g.15186  ORF Transcript_8270/g.15186 Transcript_8270/m.15186 type:complete len:282 (-) Transcript_8270:1776-2621(-)